MTPTLPATVLTLLRDVQLMKYSNFFTLTMFVYDHIIIFPDEIRHIWPWEWRVGKILYLATKYVPYVDTVIYLVFWFNKSLSAEDCRLLFNTGTWFVSSGAIIAQWILCMRTYAIWGKSKVVLVPLVTAVLGAQVGGVYAAKTLMDSLEWSLSPFPTISRCYINVRRESLLFVVYVLIMLVELTILILTVWKGISQWRSSRSPLIKILYKDSVFYFAVMFVVSMANFSMSIVAPKTSQPTLEFLLPEVQRVFFSICTSRIILNLRKASAGDSGLGMDGGTAAAKAAISTLKFGINRAFHRGGHDKLSKSVETNNKDVDDEINFGASTFANTDNWASDTYVDSIAMSDYKE